MTVESHAEAEVAPHGRLKTTDRPSSEERKATLKALLPSESSIATWFAEQAGNASDMIDKLESCHAAQARQFQRRALHAWDDDQKLIAVTIMIKLHKKPELYAAQLEASRAGCFMLMRQWLFLVKAIEANGSWTPEQESRVLDLMGVSLEEREVMKILAPPKGIDVTSHCLKIAQIELKRLQANHDTVLLTLDETERELAIEGQSYYTTKPAKYVQGLIRWYWMSYRKWLHLHFELAEGNARQALADYANPRKTSRETAAAATPAAQSPAPPPKPAAVANPPRKATETDDPFAELGKSRPPFAKPAPQTQPITASDVSFVDFAITPTPNQRQR